MSSLPKLLITGASGFTGKHACRQFSNAGFKVIAASRTSFFSEGIQTTNCDLTNKEDVIRMIKQFKPNYLLHLAGQNHVGKSWIDPISSLEANFLSTLYLIESLRHINPSCKIIIVGSALQFDPQDISALTHPYSLSKTLQVLISQAWETLYKLPIIIAKPSNLIGPGVSNGVCSIFARKIVEMEKKDTEKIIEVSNLHAQRDFIDVRDVVNAYETLFKNGRSGKVYDIASGQSRSLEDIINTFKPLTAVNFELKSQIHDQVEKKIEIETKDLTNIGWKPLIPFKVSLLDILTFYRDNTEI